VSFLAMRLGYQNNDDLFAVRQIFAVAAKNSGQNLHVKIMATDAKL